MMKNGSSIHRVEPCPLYARSSMHKGVIRVFLEPEKALWL